MTAQTPVYGIKYPAVGEPIRTTRQILQDNAGTIEAALVAGGIVPPGAPDLAALAGRVSTLETYASVRTTTGQPIASTAGTPTALTYTSATSSPAGLWSATNPTRITAPATGEYDLHAFVPWPANATGSRGVAYRISGGAWVYVNTRPASAAAYGSEQAVTAAGILLTGGQYLEVGAWQDSGVSLTLQAVGSPARAGLRRVA